MTLSCLVFYFLILKKPNVNTNPVVQKKVSPTPSSLEQPQPTLNWVTYDSTISGFSIKYPKDLKHDTTVEGERFYRLGPTQSEGAELFDGISLIIRSGKLNGRTFKNWVDAKYKETVNDPVEQRVGGKIPITIAGMQGIAFTVESLGERIVIYLPKGDKEYLEIINGTVEPQKREQTFQKIVDSMLSTIAYNN